MVLYLININWIDSMRDIGDYTCKIKQGLRLELTSPKFIVEVKDTPPRISMDLSDVHIKTNGDVRNFSYSLLMKYMSKSQIERENKWQFSVSSTLLIFLETCVKIGVWRIVEIFIRSLFSQHWLLCTLNSWFCPLRQLDILNPRFSSGLKMETTSV